MELVKDLKVSDSGVQMISLINLIHYPRPLFFTEETNKTVNEYKFRVQKAEAEVSTLQANVSTL